MVSAPSTAEDVLRRAPQCSLTRRAWTVGSGLALFDDRCSATTSGDRNVASPFPMPRRTEACSRNPSNLPETCS